MTRDPDLNTIGYRHQSMLVRILHRIHRSPWLSNCGRRAQETVASSATAKAARGTRMC